MDEEEFSYSSAVPLTNKEVLNLLNMNNVEDDNDDDNTNNNSNIEDNFTVLCNISFEKLKSKMTDILGNTKVKSMFYKFLYVFYFS